MDGPFDGFHVRAFQLLSQDVECSKDETPLICAQLRAIFTWSLIASQTSVTKGDSMPYRLTSAITQRSTSYWITNPANGFLRSPRRWHDDLWEICDRSDLANLRLYRNAPDSTQGHDGSIDSTSVT